MHIERPALTTARAIELGGHRPTIVIELFTSINHDPLQAPIRPALARQLETMAGSLETTGIDS
jgi:hypothetical protein